MAHPRSHSLIPWLLLIVAALIVYGSLYPFNFKPDAISGGVLEAVRELSWARAGRGDRISNVLLYLPLGFCLYLWLSDRWQRGIAVLAATLVGSLLSLTMEVAQVYISIRVPSLTDLALNCAGTFIGAGLGLAWSLIGGLMRLPTRAEPTTRDPSALLLIGLWLAWRWAPFVPHFDLAKLKAALRPLFNPELQLASVLVFLTCWLVVTQALAVLVSRPRMLESLLALIAAVLVGRLVVANQAFVPAELLALLALLPVLVLMYWMRPAPKRWLLLAAMLMVFVHERLAPFDFGDTAAQFDLWPFLHDFRQGWVAGWLAIDWVALFGSMFLSGALLWTLLNCGMPLAWAAGAMLALVLGTEALQLWLPERTGSITDPVLAAIVAALFRYTRRRQRRMFTGRPVSRRARNL